MEERFNLKSIWKSNDPEELIVFHASSLENEIRFYFNDEQYVVARDNNDGTLLVKCEEEKKTEQNNESTLAYIKKNIKDKDFLKFLACAIGSGLLISILIVALSIILAVVINNTLIYLLFMNFLFFFIQVIIVVTSEYKTTSPSIKSKHSAEHMMANFLEKNKRLPKNMEEIKKTSRFCVDCGSRKKIRIATEDFVQSIFTMIIALIISYFVTRNCKNEILSGIILLAIYLATSYGIWILIHKYNKLKFIINPIENMLNNIVQCSNTTKNVKDNDLQLAYYAAKYWLQVVYPEFYSEDDDIFNKSEES